MSRNRLDSEKKRAQDSVEGTSMPRVDRLASLFSQIKEIISNPSKSNETDFYVELERLKCFDLAAISQGQKKDLRTFGNLGINEMLSDILSKSVQNSEQGELNLEKLRRVSELAFITGAKFTKKQTATIQEILNQGVELLPNQSIDAYRDIVELSKLLNVPLGDDQKMCIQRAGSIIIEKILNGLSKRKYPLNVITEQMARIKDISEGTFGSLTESQEKRKREIIHAGFTQALKGGRFKLIRDAISNGLPVSQRDKKLFEDLVSQMVDRRFKKTITPFNQDPLTTILSEIKDLLKIVENAGISLSKEQRQRLREVGQYQVIRANVQFISNDKIIDPKVARTASEIAKLTGYAPTAHQRKLLNAMLGDK